MRLFMLLLAVLLLPLPASASDWQVVEKTEFLVSSIDKESIQPIEGGHYRVWVKERNPPIPSEPKSLEYVNMVTHI